MSAIKVGKKFQIVIPLEVRKKIGLQIGDELWMDADERGNIILRKKPENIAAYVRGNLKGMWKEEAEKYIAEERKSWDE